MEHASWHEFCCEGQATARGFCLHVAVFYTRCPRNHNRPAVGPAVRVATTTRMPDRLPAPGVLPLPSGLVPNAGVYSAATPPVVKPMTRYDVYHLVYEDTEHAFHKIFVHTSNEGQNRGEYLQITGSPASGLHYSELRGGEPEGALPLPLRAKTLVGTIAPGDFDSFKYICRRNSLPLYFESESGRRALAWTPPADSLEWTNRCIAKADRAGILDISLTDRAIRGERSRARAGRQMSVGMHRV